jgi:type I restriction enzyme S subunit
MNAGRLLLHYEQIADAPDAIARLRHFILDLAVRGKLVPQDANDEPARELLKRIAKEKARLVEAGEIRSEGPPIEIDKGRFPMVPPAGWMLARLAAISRRIHYGYTASADVALKDVRMLRITDIQENAVDWPCVPGCLIEPDSVNQYRLQKGDILIARTGGTIGKTFLVGDVPLTAVFASYLIRVQGTSHVFDQFLKLFLESSLYWTQLHDGTRGTGQPNVNGQTLGKLILPLPPLAEQHRIVAKVDELMALCDRLEAARGGREAVRDRLAAASLARLNAPDPDSFQADARFTLDALPALTTRPDQIKALRQTILNLAARGKLLPQDPTDEPASELLKRIAVERAELVKKKEIRREDPLDPIRSAEMPFDVAAGWVWSRIGEAVLFTQYGTSQKSNPSEKGVPVLTMGNVQDGLVVWSNEKRIPETSEDLPALYLRKFDILYNRTNSAELVGKTGIYLGDDGVRTFASYLIRLRPSLLSSNPRFLNMAMNTPEFRETQIVRLIKKQTGQANVNGTALKSMLIPIPPLAEQQRIVAKVDALMALCDRLEASLTLTAATRGRLLDALLAEALTPTAAREMEAAE